MRVAFVRTAKKAILIPPSQRQQYQETRPTCALSLCISTGTGERDAHIQSGADALALIFNLLELGTSIAFYRGMTPAVSGPKRVKREGRAERAPLSAEPRPAIHPRTRRLLESEALQEHPLSPEQTHSLDAALREEWSLEPGRLDLRCSLPLWFARFYMVVLVGRDRRAGRRQIEDGRRERAGRLAALVVSYAVFSMVGMALLIGALSAAYAAKSAAGIDLFPQTHLADILREAVS